MPVTTIQLEKETLKKLKTLRKYPRQTYNEIITEMITMVTKSTKTSQYDSFLHNIQQQKMKELWNNKEDEKWEKA